MKKGKLTAVVAVRKGSQRIPNKNITPFGDSNLLEMKLKVLKANMKKILKNLTMIYRLIMSQTLKRIPKGFFLKG